MYSVQELPDGITNRNPGNAVNNLKTTTNEKESNPAEYRQDEGSTGLGITSLPISTTSDQLYGSPRGGARDEAIKDGSKSKQVIKAREEKDGISGRSQYNSKHLPNKSNGFSHGGEPVRHDEGINSKEPPNHACISDHLQESSENHLHGGHIPYRADIPLDALLEVDKDRVSKKLSASQIHELTSSPESLSLRRLPQTDTINSTIGTTTLLEQGSELPDQERILKRRVNGRDRSGSEVISGSPKSIEIRSPPMSINSPPQEQIQNMGPPISRPLLSFRTISTPPSIGKPYSSSRTPRPETTTPKPRRDPPILLPLDAPVFSGRKGTGGQETILPDPTPSPMPQSIPLPPLSLPTYLQLELSSSRPSPLYIHRSATSDFPYESSRIKFERLQNFLLLPPNLEGVLWFGALACLDAWLYSFTILPLRFLKAVAILGRWWGQNLLRETQDIALFIYSGLGRMWHRRRLGIDSGPASSIHSPVAPRSRKGSDTFDPDQPWRLPVPVSNTDSSAPQSYSDQDRKRKRAYKRHRRTKSTPSALLPSHKADLLKGLVVLFSCVILTRFDASRMYHGIRGQAAIKLYVIYNVLEVGFLLFVPACHTKSSSGL
jgi:hypothetical protein